jgi:hypothetical protein
MALCQMALCQMALCQMALPNASLPMANLPNANLPNVYYGSFILLEMRNTLASFLKQNILFCPLKATSFTLFSTVLMNYYSSANLPIVPPPNVI